MRQVEFYFADTNLPYDKFMWSLYTKDPVEHWIPLAVIASFKRMREYQSKGTPWLVDVLKGSSEIEVKEADAASEVLIRRRTAPAEPKSSLERSVYAKGFPIPPCSTPSFPDLTEEVLQIKLESYFALFAPVVAVRMRRDEAKKFKGSVFVEFATAQGVDDFLLGSDDEPKGENGKAKRVWEGYDLIVMTKEEYCDMKIKEKGLTGKAAVHRREMMVSRKFDAFKLMEKEKKGPSPASGPASDVQPIYLDFFDVKLEIKPDENGLGTVDPTKVPFIAHASLRWDNSGENVAWNDLKTPLKDLFEGRTPYIKNVKGTTYGMVGFHRELTDADLQKVEKALPVLDGGEVRWSWIAEEDEKAFQLERAQVAARTALRNHAGAAAAKRSGRGSAGGRGRGARGGRFAERKSREGTGSGEKRKRPVDDDGAPPAPDAMDEGDREANASASK